MDWRKGDALEPQGFAELFPEVDGVVHTLGTLFENSLYKQAVRGSSLAALIGNMLGSANPLENTGPSYELLNRDSGEQSFCSVAHVANRDSSAGMRSVFGLRVPCKSRQWTTPIYLCVCRRHLSTRCTCSLHRDQTGGGTTDCRDAGRRPGVSASVHQARYVVTFDALCRC